MVVRARVKGKVSQELPGRGPTAVQGGAWWNLQCFGTGRRNQSAAGPAPVAAASAPPRPHYQPLRLSVAHAEGLFQYWYCSESLGFTIVTCSLLSSYLSARVPRIDGDPRSVVRTQSRDLFAEYGSIRGHHFIYGRQLSS